MNEIKINSPSTFRFEIIDKVDYWNDESPSTQSYFGKFYQIIEKTKRMIQKLEAKIDKQTYRYQIETYIHNRFF